MKFKVGDKVLVTGGKDKGKKSVIVSLLANENKVVVKDVNLYVKHVKPFMDKPGEKVRRERALNVANIAILNDQDQADRIAYRLTADGKKERVFKKTGKLIEDQKLAASIKETKQKDKKKKAVDKKEESKQLVKAAAIAEQKVAQRKEKSAQKISRIRKTQDKG